ncbi:MAG: efflux RND transporter periplasmic adaptor subunit, partial [Victivallales bacterium]|nr:efflux RND transporter periplasmic adaptor subunit [Victivallales bacterium]
MKGKIILIILLVAVVAGGLFYRKHQKSLEEANSLFASGNGRLEATEISISTKLAGRIDEIMVDEGDFVKENQPLVQMQLNVLNAQLAQAEAKKKQAITTEASAFALIQVRESEVAAANAAVAQKKSIMEGAQKRYGRTQALHKKEVVSDQKLVEIESELAQAKALHAAAKRQVEECTLHAPCNGLINGLNIVAGQSVIPDVTLCTIMDLTGFQVRFTVPENEVSRVGESGIMECAAVDSVFPVTVMERNLQGNALTHTYEVVAAVEGGEEVLM